MNDPCLKPKIGIIGGSISGCISAILFQRAGYDVTVFERSSEKLKSRGAGIVLPQALIKKLITDDLLDKSIEHFLIKSREFIVKDENSDLLGRVIWEQSFEAGALNWGMLFHSLRKRVADRTYHLGCVIQSIENKPDHVNVTLDTGDQQQFDLLISADGYRSLGRQTLFPDAKLNFSYYVAWRGTVDINDLLVAEHFEHNVLYYLYQKGHVVTYLIPKIGGGYLLNWVLYENLTDHQITYYLTDKDNRKQQGSIPPGMLSQKQIHHLNLLAKHSFPTELADAIYKTKNPFIQAVYDLATPKYCENRIALIGDAAYVLRPHVASGAVKALQDALALFEAVSQGDDIYHSLEAWNNAQIDKAKSLFELGRLIGKQMVTEVPNWQTMDANKLEKWWAKIIGDKNWYTSSSGGM